MIHMIRCETQGKSSRTKEGAASTSQVGQCPLETAKQARQVHSGLSKPPQNVRESFRGRKDVLNEGRRA